MTPLQLRTYSLLKQVPSGRITTYKALAQALGTRAYRAIGQFMRNNPYSYEECSDRKNRIPCHRVIASNGTIGGFMGKINGEEIEKKVALLKKEGISVHNGVVTNFTAHLYQFDILDIDR